MQGTGGTALAAEVCTGLQPSNTRGVVTGWLQLVCCVIPMYIYGHVGKKFLKDGTATKFSFEFMMGFLVAMLLQYDFCEIGAASAGGISVGVRVTWLDRSYLPSRTMLRGTLNYSVHGIRRSV